MTTKQAVAAAKDWIVTQAAGMEGYCGAYLSGSVLERGEDEVWPFDSDVDVVLVFDGKLPDKIGKLRHGGVLLEITGMEKAPFTDFEKVMTTHYLAFALNGGAVLDDPQGFLEPLARRVHAAFWQEKWLWARAEMTGEIAFWHIASMTKRRHPEDRFMSCGFGPSAITLPILAAAGWNCTVRKRVTKAREVLRQFGYSDFARRIEQALGCEEMTVDQLMPHMDALERVYSLAMMTEGPSAEYPFRSDIRPDAKEVAVGGTRQMLAGEHPTDAVFWMIATFARCMNVLHMDDMAAYEACLPDMQAFACALGVDTEEKAAQRQKLAHEIREEAMGIAERIAAAAAQTHKG